MSNHKAITEHLERSQSLLRAIVQHAALGISIIDRNGRIIQVNPAYEKITKFSEAELLTMSLSDLNHPDDDAGNQDKLRQLFAGDLEHFSVDKRYLRKDGKVVWVRVSATRLDEGSNMALGMVQDISEERERERERTERERALAASNRQLEQFAYAASHDLQAPLRHVTTFGQLLERSAGDRLHADEQEWLQQMVYASRRMSAMVESLLQYSQVQQGDMEDGEVDLVSVLAQSVDTLRDELALVGGKVEWADLPVVRGNRHLLGHLFQNLLENAIKYRSDAPPRVRVTAERIVDHHVIQVTDNGRGFEPEQGDRIFGMFRRLDGEGKGAGIGLAICRLAVERHGGSITATGQPGKGATFTIRLPTR